MTHLHSAVSVAPMPSLALPMQTIALANSEMPGNNLCAIVTKAQIFNLGQ